LKKGKEAVTKLNHWKQEKPVYLFKLNNLLLLKHGIGFQQIKSDICYDA
jgi:hypothetical protein